MIPYILYAGLILAGCLSFYKILLQKETFFRLNRFVLLGCILLSFSLPFIPVPEKWSFRRSAETEVIVSPDQTSLLPSLSVVPKTEEQPVSTPVVSKKTTPFTLEKALTWLFWIYWFGVAAFGINFLIQLTLLLWRAYRLPVIRDGKFRIVEMKGDKAPCSFGNNIFINPEKYDWETYNQILMHEKLHIEQGHSFDIMIAELVLVFQWFNPFAWIYRREMENNLEFLTDSELLQRTSVEKTSYQLSLLKVSAPHFPLSLTTNYNQSLLKKRLVMMNAKRSNINSTWKYFFLLPMLITFACFFNEPMANAQNDHKKDKHEASKGIDTEGSWFATIEGDKISMQFKAKDEDRNSFSGNTFELSEFKNLPREQSGSFSLTREAGTMNFTGKFEGNQGMGSYKFVPDRSFADDLRKQGIDEPDDFDMMAYFFVNLKRSYVAMLKANGYTDLSKNDLLPMAALHVDEGYIKSIKAAGFSDIGIKNLIPFKALGVTADYINDLRKTNKDLSVHKVISYKAQGIDSKYIADMREALGKENNADNDGNAADDNGRFDKNKDKIKDKDKSDKANKDKVKNKDWEKDRRNGATRSREVDPGRERDDDDDIIAVKALGVDVDYIKSIRDAGFTDISTSQLISMKALGVDAAYIKGLRAKGFKDLSPGDVVGLKSQNVTGEFRQSFEALGYNDIDPSDLIALKATGVTPAYIKSWHDAGFDDVSLHDAISLRSQGVTPALANEYKALGFSKVSLSDVIGAKVMGATPAFIKAMKAKGHDFPSLSKYIQLKAAID